MSKGNPEDDRSMAKQGRSFAIIGLGMFGSTIATALAAFGDDVLGIDLDEGRVRHYADQLSRAVIADARDDEALKEAGLADYDVAVVAIGEDLEANILCCMNARLIGVSEIWAKAFSRTHHRILSRIGVDRVIRPERDMGQHVAETLHTPFVADYVSLGNGYHVVNLVVQEKMAGQKSGEFAQSGSEKVRFLGLMRGTVYHDCTDPSFVLEKGDRLLVLGTRETLRQLADRL
jgi:trk system potassium uptake protein TrkA